MAGLQVFSGDLRLKKGRHIPVPTFSCLCSVFMGSWSRCPYRFSSQLPSSRTNQPSGVMRFANMIPFVPSETLLRERDVAERPGDVRLRRPQRSGDIRTVRARQGLNIEKRAIHRMTLFSISLRARDGIRTRDPRLGKAILHHWATRAYPCSFEQRYHTINSDTCQLNCCNFLCFFFKSIYLLF